MAGESIEREKSAKRWRWLSLGEALAIAAVLISALTFWDNHSDRARERDRADAAASKASAQASVMVLRGTPDRSGGRITLTPLHGDQAVQAQTFAMPTALGVNPVDTAGDPRIEAEWFAAGLKKALKAAGHDDPGRGDVRLPVLISTSYLVDGRMLRDSAIYDVGVALEGQFLGGDKVRLRGLSLVSHADAKSARQQLDARWRKLHPPTGTKKAQ